MVCIWPISSLNKNEKQRLFFQKSIDVGFYEKYGSRPNDLANVLDKQGQADVVIMDFSKAFEVVSHQRWLLINPIHFEIFWHTSGLD